MPEDDEDRHLAQWRQERPDLDFAPWAITRRITRLATFLHYRERTYEPFGLNRGGVEVLFALRRSSPDYRLSPTGLCQTLLCNSATMTSRLDRLEQAELVRRIPDLTDRRALIVEMTPKGRALSDQLIEAVLEARATQIAALNADESALLVDLLRKVLLSYEDSPEDD